MNVAYCVLHIATDPWLFLHCRKNMALLATVPSRWLIEDNDDEDDHDDDNVELKEVENI